MRWLGTLLAAVAATALVGCSAGAEPQPETVSNPRLDAPPSSASGPTTSTGSADVPNPPVATPPSLDVRVEAEVLVSPGADVRALLMFVEEHARSVNAGYSTPRLRAVTAPALLAGQEEVIGWAGSQGYGVPDRPRVAVVAAARAGQTSYLDLCLWLPSTEFVDRATGAAVDPSVPATWKPARATLARHNERWRVDRLANADEQKPTVCGGL
jgi:hypothetical protein